MAEDVLSWSDRRLASWARDQWAATKAAVHEVLCTKVPDRDKVRCLMGLLPPGANICAYATVREDGRMIEDSYADLGQLHGFCATRGRKAFDYGSERKPMGLMSLIRPVDNRVTGNVHFGDAGWLKCRGVRTSEAGVGYRYDAFSRGGSWVFREGKHPGSLQMFVQMFQRAADDQLDAPFDLPRLRVTIPRSRREMRCWPNSAVFRSHLVQTVRTGRWGVASLAGLTHVREDCDTVFEKDQYTLSGAGGVETSLRADVEHAIEQEIREIFGVDTYVSVEPQHQPHVRHELRSGDSLWRPANIKAIAEEAEAERDVEAIVERLKGLDAGSKRQYQAITLWAALTTMIEQGSVNSLDGTFVSSISAPRVQSLAEPCVFMTFGRDLSLRSGPPRYPKFPFTQAEGQKWKEEWAKQNIIVMDFNNPGGLYLAQLASREKGKVRFTPARSAVPPVTA